MFLVKKKHTDILIIWLIFFIIFGSISFVNHYNFRTYALDLGLFNNTLYDYAHFKWNELSLLFPTYYIKNTLADHFSLYSFFYTPFYFIFGSYTFLIFQIFSILFGSLGIYKLVLFKSNNEHLSKISMVYFLSVWGIYTALAFDYHDNVVASMLVPWLICFILKEKLKSTFLFYILIIISKENIALWLGFICFAMLLTKYKNKWMYSILLIMSLLAFCYFYFIVHIIIPGFNNPYIHFDYNIMGDNMSDAVKLIITKPFYVFKLLFINHFNNPVGNGLKLSLHLAVMFAGGFALIFKPKYLFMLIPIYGQKLLHDRCVNWGLYYHYSIEFVPVLTMALFFWIIDFKSDKIKYIISFLCLTGCIINTFYIINQPAPSYYNAEMTQFYTKTHWVRNYNVHKIYTHLKIIPKNAKVSAQNLLCPHLAFRDDIYQFPYVGNAEYIALILNDNYYPLNKETFTAEYRKYLEDKNWQIEILDYPLLILKKSNNTYYNIQPKLKLIKQISCNAEEVSPDKNFFISEPKQINGFNGVTQSDKKSFSGKYSCKTTKDQPYGITYVLSDFHIGDLISVSAWCTDTSRKAAIVASSTDGKELYISSTHIVDSIQNWRKITLDFILTKEICDSTLKIYLWNKGSDTVFFDDFNIKTFRNLKKL